ncbi:MAG: hypothetical protein AAFV54_08165, partial [Pseudomonadota bacterium]
VSHQEIFIQINQWYNLDQCDSSLAGVRKGTSQKNQLIVLSNLQDYSRRSGFASQGDGYSLELAVN